MKLDGVGLLAYLHDAVVVNLCWDSSRAGSRTFVLTVECDPEAGYAAWKGKALRVSADNVLLLGATLWGYVAGEDSVDTWEEGVSRQTAAELRALEARGVSLPPRLFTIALHSGSCIELACESLKVEQTET